MPILATIAKPPIGEKAKLLGSIAVTMYAETPIHHEARAKIVKAVAHAPDKAGCRIGLFRECHQ